MWTTAANLDGFHEAYTSCPRPSSCGVWNGSARLSRDAGGEQLGPVPLIQLIGTRKGGTTALSDLMLAHPHLLAPDCSTHKQWWPRVAQGRMCLWDKEVRYFSLGFRSPASAKQPLGSMDLCWYRSLYPCVPGGAPHVGFDGSPDYLTMPEDKVAAMRLALGAQAKLVALLRNPADRFYSAYNMGMNEELGKSGGFGRRRRNRRELLVVRDGDGGDGGSGSGGGGAVASRGREMSEKAAGEKVAGELTYQGFAAALPRYLKCAPECKDERGPVWMFFAFGMYAEHLRKFQRHFAESQLLVLRSEDFYADAWSVVEQVYRFAGLPILDGLQEGVLRSSGKRNAGSLWGGSSYTGKLQAKERALLHAYYGPHNQELYALIGRDMGWEQMASADAGHS